MTYINDLFNFPEQGWQCPICKRVYAPSVPMCFYCGNTRITTTSDTNLEESNSDTETNNNYEIDTTDSKE